MNQQNNFNTQSFDDPCSRNFQNEILARRKLFDRSSDFRKIFFQRRAMIRPQFKDGNFPAGKILLIAQIFVRKDEDLKAFVFRLVEQITVGNAAPAHALRGRDFVAFERVTHLERNALVEQDFYAAASTSMRCQP